MGVKYENSGLTLYRYKLTLKFTISDMFDKEMPLSPFKNLYQADNKINFQPL